MLEVVRSPWTIPVLCNLPISLPISAHSSCCSGSETLDSNFLTWVPLMYSIIIVAFFLSTRKIVGVGTPAFFASCISWGSLLVLEVRMVSSSLDGRYFLGRRFFMTTFFPCHSARKRLASAPFLIKRGLPILSMGFPPLQASTSASHNSRQQV